jgi:hypothetical protein
MLTFGFIITCIVSHCLYKHFIDVDRRRNRVIPLDRLIRVLQLRQQVREEQYKHYMTYDNVMGELKNKIIIINPDENITLGIEN